MPQLQQGQVIPGQSEAPKLYGVDQQDNTILFQEKLMRKFKPQEFVTIKNIDDDPLYWQYLPADAEEESYSDDGLQRQIRRGKPEMWYIPAGATEVVVGASAYRALDVLYKNVAAKSVLNRSSNPNSASYDPDGRHVARNFNFSDSSLQDSVIERAYLGKATPYFGTPPVAEAEAPVAQPVSAPVAQAPAPQPAAAPVASGVIDPNEAKRQLMPESEASSELKRLNAEIAERRQYKKDQERIINELVETGNRRLQDLNIDIAFSKKELRELKTDIRSAKSDKKLAYEDLAQVRKDIKDELDNSGLSLATA